MSGLADWPGRVVMYSVEGLSQPGGKTGVKKMTLVASKSQGEYEAYDVKLDGETSFHVRSQHDAAFPTDSL